MKSFLFVNRKPPFGTGHAAETLEAVLVAAAFDQAVHLAFLDDGVFQLVDGQRPEAAGLRPFAENFAELAELEVEDLWVERESLEERGLSASDLLIPVTILDRADLARRMAAMDVVISA